MSRKHRPELAFITGGSSGIGLAVARALTGAGTSVLLIARRPDLLEHARQSLESTAAGGAGVHTLALDVADHQSVQREISAAMDRLGIPDLLINGAGTAHCDHFGNIDHTTIQRLLDVNVGGVWNVLSAVLPRMRERGRGTVVNVSSVSGFLGYFGYTAYAASKFAVIGLSQSLRNELKPDGIDVKVLCPPDTDTPQLAEENRTKPPETKRISGNGKVERPDDVARTLIRGLGRRSFLILPGFIARFSWIVYRLAPGLVHAIIDADVRAVRRGRE